MATVALKPLDVDVADVIGVKAPQKGRMSTFDLMSEVERGLPAQTVDRVAQTIAPKDVGFRNMLMPRSTLARKLKDDKDSKLSQADGERIARVAHIWVETLKIWKNTEDARAFLETPHPMLEGKTPKSLMVKSEIGARMVEDLLGRLRYGSAA